MRVHKGCPLCENDVLGTSETGYYCKECNVIFRKEHIVFRHMKEETKRLITKHFSGFDEAPRREPPRSRFLERMEERRKERAGAEEAFAVALPGPEPLRKAEEREPTRTMRKPVKKAAKRETKKGERGAETGGKKGKPSPAGSEGEKRKKGTGESKTGTAAPSKRHGLEGML